MSEACPNCKESSGGTLVTMKTCEGFKICLTCRAVYRDGNLFGFYKAPKGAFAHGYALEQAADGTTVPRLDFCDQTITVEGMLLNCVLQHEHAGGRMHKSGCMIKGIWVSVEWDLGQKKG